jgi:LacI family transcriptional regulator, fructose operon transcriptional repressor
VAKEQGICIFRGNSDEDPAKEVMCLKVMRDDRVAGIILSPTLKTSNSFIEITNSYLPIAAIDRCVPGFEINRVPGKYGTGLTELTWMRYGFEKDIWSG